MTYMLRGYKDKDFVVNTEPITFYGNFNFFLINFQEVYDLSTKLISPSYQHPLPSFIWLVASSDIRKENKYENIWRI